MQEPQQDWVLPGGGVALSLLIVTSHLQLQPCVLGAPWQFVFYAIVPRPYQLANMYANMRYVSILVSTTKH